MWSRITTFLAALLFIACTPIPEGEGLFETLSVPKQEKVSEQFEFIELYKVEPLIEDLPLEKINEGTKVEILVKGMSLIPKFSEVYEKAVETRFRDLSCNKMPCFPARGYCYPKFRDFLGYSERIIDFELKPPVLVIGNKELEVPVELQEVLDNGWVRFKVEIASSMLEEGKLSILAPVKENGRKIATGMIDLGDRKRCEGIRIPDFRVLYKGKSAIIPVDPVDQYYVTVNLEKKI